MEVNVVTLENNKEYIIIDAIEHNNKNYLVLAKEDDAGNFCVRRVVVENDGEFLERLDTKEEFDSIMKIFYEKNKGMIGKNEE